MAKKTKPEGELIPADDKPQWLVVSTEPDLQGRQLHRLLYGKARQSFGRTPGDLRRFREIAEFCNARDLEPREKVQCLADDNIPAPPKRKSADAPGSDECEPAVEPIHGKI